MVFVIRRLIQSLIVVLVMSLVVFVGIHVVGDPVHILISDDMTQAEIERFVHKLGLDRPLYEQYFHFLGNAVRGDLGNSFGFAAHLARLGLGLDLGYHWRSEHPRLPYGDSITLGPWASYGLSEQLSLRAEVFAEKHVSTRIAGADF